MKRLKGFGGFIWPLLGSAILWALIGLVSGKFTAAQFYTCAKLSTFAMLLGLAQMTVVTSGDGAIDLSQVYSLTLCAFVACHFMVIHTVLGLFMAILAGCLCGLANGLINGFFRVPAMITTLATGYILFSVNLVSAPFLKTLPNPAFVDFINTNIGGISMLTFIVVLAALLLALLLYGTPYGKRLHAVGQNRTAAACAGIPVRTVVISAFTLAGGLTGLAGALCGAFIGGAFQDMGSTYFLPSVAATFVGGTAASGGRSNVAGVCLGALMMSFMSMFLNTANLSPGVQRFIQGLFLVCILIASASGGGRAGKRRRGAAQAA
ncbi:MAG: ABC transporter permease [Treponema sp.]|jgi:ribose transport system permease protein|nr:ABC transporter permease [Treponema sp.]